MVIAKGYNSIYFECIKMKAILFAIIFSFVCKCCFAGDTIIVHKDPRLDLFTAKQSEVNKRTSNMTSNGHYKGYRLQVLTTRSREKAFELKSKLLQMFPLQKTYVVFQSPYFKVRLGNFINKPDAVSFKDKLSKKYPQTAYVIEDVIEYTPKEDEDFPSSN